MPGKQTARPSPARSRRPTNGGGVATTAPYVRDARWSTPATRRRTDVFLVDISDRFSTGDVPSDDPLALTA